MTMMTSILFLLTIYGLLFYTNNSVGKQQGHGWAVSGHLHALLLLHLGASFFFHFYVQAYGGDAVAYWKLTGPLANPNAQGWWDYFGVGYPFMYWLNYLPSKVLGWDILVGHLLYGAVGFLGFRFLFVLLCLHGANMKALLGVPWITLFLYLPNLHFWTASIGKEAICFLGLVLVLRGMDSAKKITVLAGVLGLGLIFMVRTYLAWVILLAVGTSILLFGPTKKIRLWVGLSVLVVVLGAFPVLLWYLGIDHVSVEELQGVIARQFAMLSGRDVGSSVDMVHYGQLMRMFTYWFRPLFFDAHNATAWMASVENAILLGSYLFLPFFIQPARWAHAPFFLKFGLVLFIFSSILYANILGNLGIMMRMKSLFILLPIFVGCYLSVFQKHKLSSLE